MISADQLHDAADRLATNDDSDARAAALVVAEFIETTGQIQDTDGRPIEVWSWREILGYGLCVGMLGAGAE